MKHSYIFILLELYVFRHHVAYSINPNFNLDKSNIKWQIIKQSTFIYNCKNTFDNSHAANTFDIYRAYLIPRQNHKLVAQSNKRQFVVKKENKKLYWMLIDKNIFPQFISIIFVRLYW